MNGAKQFFDEYVQDRRRQKIERFTLEDFGHLVRYTPQTDADGWVTFSRFKASETKAIISEQVDYFRSLGKSFEWKVYDFDEPENLQSLLVELGFVADKQEVFMACSVHAGADAVGRANPWEIMRIETEQGVRDVVAVQEQVWNRKFGWLTEQLLAGLTKQPERLSIYCAYLEGRPVGTGWTDFPEGSKFPELHGGAVLQDLRGQGIYKALYGRRLLEAANRKYETITVDASPMSRPILEKMGFIRICNTVPMCYRIT
jgi:hypothetical protein